MEKCVCNKRSILFKVLVGSHNYNLNGPTSDRDYKVIVAPTFDELYSGSMFSKQKVGKQFDIEVHDIRKLSQVWTKANVNFLEILFSRETLVNPTLNKDTQVLLQTIFSMKEDIARMNLEYLYNACLGMHMQKMKLLTKGTSGTVELVDRFGYDTKQAQHAYRVLDFLVRFSETYFADFKNAIWYYEYDPMYALLKNIKSGVYDLEDFRTLTEEKLTYVKEKVSPLYNSQLDISVHNELTDAIKEIVRLNI